MSLRPHDFFLGVKIFLKYVNLLKFYSTTHKLLSLSQKQFEFILTGVMLFSLFFVFKVFDRNSFRINIILIIYQLMHIDSNFTQYLQLFNVNIVLIFKSYLDNSSSISITIYYILLATNDL